MQYLANLMRSLGAVELFITSDGSNDMKPSSDMAPSNGEGVRHYFVVIKIYIYIYFL